MTTGNANNFQVVIRVRPPITRETRGKDCRTVVKVTEDHKGICVSESFGHRNEPDYQQDANLSAMYTFGFDHVYDQDAAQQTVYETTGKAAVESTLQGYNATILAYGQTGSGMLLSTPTHLYRQDVHDGRLQGGRHSRHHSPIR